MEEHDPKAWQEAQEMVRQLSKFVNPMGLDHKYFTSAMEHEHRTLQQSMFGLFLSCIKEWAETKEGHYDLRNEHTVKTSRKIMAALENDIRVPLV